MRNKGFKHFPELDLVEKITHRLSKQSVPFERSTLATIECRESSYPVHGFVIGSKDVTAPTFGLFGGVHGLEKIGTHVILNYLSSLAYKHSLNSFTQKKFENIRVVVIPMVNPYGVRHNKRGNSRGVDLMRNAPVDAEGSTIPLASGHRISPKIWWYRGQKNVLEKESQAVINFVKEQMFPSRFSMALDVHSGFGYTDRLWYPYAKTYTPFPDVKKAKKFKRIMKLSNPFHIYKVETQTDSYLINGDLWDYLYDMHYNDPEFTGTFIPWTLEMGSWMWVRKNPLQLFKATGLFHPIKPHRVSRIMRRHWWLFDFFTYYITAQNEGNPAKKLIYTKSRN